MKLSSALMYAGNPREAADQVSALEKAGLDTIWVAEAYGFDSPTLMGYLAAKTERIQIGSGIVNVFSRTPTLLGMTAAGLDFISDGRAILGLAILSSISDERPARPEGHSGERFFVYFKERVIHGFYTSRAGLEELGYRGNAYYASPPGCEHLYA